MPKPDISIIVPTFNRAWSIERAIQSVFNQTDEHWELIVVDDGSTDNTEDVVQKYLSDNRIQYLKKENGGVGSARNLGIEKANNQFLTFLDSDDEFTPNTVEQMREDAFTLEKRKDISIILYLAKKEHVPSYRDNRFSDNEIIDYESAITGRWPRVETVQLCRKGTFRKRLFPTLHAGHEDILWFGILKYEGPALLRTKILRIYYTEHQSRLTSSAAISDRARTMPQLYTLFLAEFEEDYKRLNPSGLAVIHLEKAIYEIIDGRAEEGLHSARNTLRLNKRELPMVIFVFCASALPRKWFQSLARVRHTIRHTHWF